MDNNALQARLDRFESRLDQIVQALGDVSTRLTRIEERQATAATSIEKVEARVAALEQRATVLEGQVVTLRETDQKFDARLTKLVLIAAAIAGALGAGGEALVTKLMGG